MLSACSVGRAGSWRNFLRYLQRVHPEYFDIQGFLCTEIYAARPCLDMGQFITSLILLLSSSDYYLKLPIFYAMAAGSEQACQQLSPSSFPWLCSVGQLWSVLETAAVAVDVSYWVLPLPPFSAITISWKAEARRRS